MRELSTTCRFLFTAGFIVLSSLSFAGTAVLNFKVVNEHNLRLPGIEIKVYNGNNLSQTEFALNGKLKLKLLTGRYYTIEVARNGYITKRLVVDTRSEEVNHGKYRYDFIVELYPVERFAQLDEADEFLDYPVTKIEFDPEGQRFTYNRDYQLSCQEHKRSVFAESRMVASSGDE